MHAHQTPSQVAKLVDGGVIKPSKTDTTPRPPRDEKEIMIKDGLDVGDMKNLIESNVSQSSRPVKQSIQKRGIRSFTNYASATNNLTSSKSQF